MYNTHDHVADFVQQYLRDEPTTPEGKKQVEDFLHWYLQVSTQFNLIKK